MYIRTINQIVAIIPNAKLISQDRTNSSVAQEELTKIVLTSNSLSEYAVMSALYKMIEAGNRIVNDPEKRARCKKIYRR